MSYIQKYINSAVKILTVYVKPYFLHTYSRKLFIKILSTYYVTT